MCARRYYSEQRLVDIIADCHNVILLLPRFNIPFGFGDMTVEEICRRHEVDMDLFLIVCSIYSGNKGFGERRLGARHLPSLLTYLYNSHKYYKEDSIPHIESHLERMTSEVTQSHRTVLMNFWKEYKKEILLHFKREEELIFPAAQKAVEEQQASQPRIRKKMASHGEIEDKLKDITNIIIRYMPNSGLAMSDRLSVIFDLYQLTDDLSGHAYVEKELLMPMIEGERGQR